MQTPDLTFPKFMKNDLEDYLIFFPRKFPLLVQRYEELVEKYWDKPEELDNYCQRFLVKELWDGYNKIRSQFDSKPMAKRTVSFLVDIDMKMQKLNCFRFWIVNYALCEGPLNTHFHRMIKKYAEILGKDYDHEKEAVKIESLERDLLRGTYKDLYLHNALSGIELFEQLSSIEETKITLKKLQEAIASKNVAVQFELVEEIGSFATKNKSKYKKLFKALEEALLANDVKGNTTVTFATIVGAVEFREKNLKLQEDFENMKLRIKEIFDLAKKNLSDDEFKEFKLSYDMLLKFKKFKDDFGYIDSWWLPFWFQYLLPEIESKINAPAGSCVGGQGSIFYNFPWYFPSEHLETIYDIDKTDFSLAEL